MYYKSTKFALFIQKLSNKMSLTKTSQAFECYETFKNSII